MMMSDIGVECSIWRWMEVLVEGAEEDEAEDSETARGAWRLSRERRVAAAGLDDGLTGPHSPSEQGDGGDGAEASGYFSQGCLHVRSAARSGPWRRIAC